MAGSDDVGLRPILVVALALTVVVGVPLLVDLWNFAGRELEYRKFRRLHAGEYDDRLPDGWTPTNAKELSQRLMRARDLL